MHFEYPIFLILIPLILIGLVLVSIFRRYRVNIFSLSFLPSKKSLFLSKFLYYLPVAILAISLCLLLISLANPRLKFQRQSQSVNGIAIMLVQDMSGSMEAEDFLPKNRLDVCKTVVSNFIKRRTSDLIGMIVFGTDAFVLSPLTIDYRLIINKINQLQVGQIDGQTAIGTAIIRAVNHLKNAPAKSKIIILLTDGDSNAGDIDPITAAHIAAAMGVKIYTIGIGKAAGAPVPYNDPVRGKQYYRNPDGSLYLAKFDGDALKRIADITQGIYFRAEDTDSLFAIYAHIDKLEKTVIKDKKSEYFQSDYCKYALTGFVVFLIYAVVDLAVLGVLR